MIDLSPFHDPIELDSRWSRPWQKDGKILATDGRILVLIENDGRQVEWNETRRPNAEDIFRTGFNETNVWHDLPSDFHDPDCDDCGNTRLITEECDECFIGTVECNYGHEHDCPDCDGEGEIESVCDCTYRHPVMLSNRKIARHYVRAIKTLPNVKFGVSSDDPEQIVWFRFDGGKGAVMPIAPKKLSDD